MSSTFMCMYTSKVLNVVPYNTTLVRLFVPAVFPGSVCVQL
jgi:hypothetical protein